MFVTEDVVAELANRDPRFWEGFFVLHVECSLSGQSIKSETDKVGNSGVSGGAVSDLLAGVEDESCDKRYKSKLETMSCQRESD
jgi:hypothetical protein